MAKKKTASSPRSRKKKTSAKAHRPAKRRKTGAAKSSTGEDVRKRVHNLTLKAVRDGELKIRDLPKLARELIEDAATELNNAVPQSSRNVLRQVVDGLTDATTATVHSTKSAVSSMAKRGTQFVKHDAARTMKDLRNLEGDFLTALERAGKSLTGAARDEMNAIVRNARRAGTKIKPAAQSVMKAADGRLLELGSETAKAGARATRSAMSGMLKGASGFLDGLGEAVGPRRTSTRSRSRSR